MQANALWQNHVTFLTQVCCPAPAGNSSLLSLPADLRSFLQHVNAYTGRRHRDDATIMAWQLANEPRAASEGEAQAYISWLDSASRFLKAAAPMQLVSSGSEGDTAWYSASQSILATQSLPSLDYVTAHLWVQNWNKYAPGMSETVFESSTIPWAIAYIAASASEAAKLAKRT